MTLTKVIPASTDKIARDNGWRRVNEDGRVSFYRSDQYLHVYYDEQQWITRQEWSLA